MSSHFVYVLECDDGTYYTGYTTDVARRVAEHDAGDGAKYTRGRTPVSLVHVETYESRSAAMSREHEIKSLSRASKECVVADSPEPTIVPGGADATEAPQRADGTDSSE